MVNTLKKLMLRFGTRVMAFNMRTIGIVILCLSPMLLCFQCGVNYFHTGRWYVHNRTDQTLTLSFPPDHYWKDRNIAPGNVVRIQEYRYTITKRERAIPHFDHLPRNMASYSSGKVSLDILSKNGDLLKRWSYSDKNLPEKNFFKELGWRSREEKDEHGRITITWFFDIMPEDLD